ncbi:MAG: twin-arginine translocase subunit TatB [Sideroxydans sp.]|nr:twin-arginine translocase subunit TatB [Sideroxydans sp.]
MFDVAFSELVVVALVALIVIGPERLPQVARTAGHLWSRAQRYVNTVKNDISNEMDLDAARKMKESLMQDVTAIEKEVQHDISEIKQEVQSAQLTIEQQVLQAYHRVAPPVELPEHAPVVDTPQKSQ